MSEKPLNGDKKSDQRVESPAARSDPAASALKSSLVAGAQDWTEGVKHLADDVKGQTRKGAESQLVVGKTRAADGLGSVAHALRKTGEQLRAEDNGALTEYIERAAHQVDAASGYLQRRSVGELLGDVKQFARREPALFLGGAFVAGLLGGRFLKSSGLEESSGAQAAHPQGGGSSRPQGQGEGRDARQSKDGDRWRSDPSTSPPRQGEAAGRSVRSDSASPQREGRSSAQQEGRPSAGTARPTSGGPSGAGARWGDEGNVKGAPDNAGARPKNTGAG